MGYGLPKNRHFLQWTDILNTTNFEDIRYKLFGFISIASLLTLTNLILTDPLSFTIKTKSEMKITLNEASHSACAYH